MTINTDWDWGREGIGTSNQDDLVRSMGIRLGDIEAGPSHRRVSSSSASSASYTRNVDALDATCRCKICLKSQHRHIGRKPRRSKPSSTTNLQPYSSLLLPTFLLPFLPSTFAAPAPVPPPSRTHRLTPRSNSATATASPASTFTSIDATSSVSSESIDPSTTFDEHRKIQYLTSVSIPSILPTDNVYVDETVLPYLLSRHDDGYWRRVEGGWSIYGRQIAAPTHSPGTVLADDGQGSVDDSQPTHTAASYAVESVLPNGWGVSSNRTSLYKIPLIATASVIMAAGIVAFIIFYVLGRRKKHRKRKRAKERLRRKALAAAGIKEEELNSTAAETAFKEKLQELEEQHMAKKKRSGQAGVAKAKVRVWNQRLGMRRRKNKATTKTLDEDEDGARISVDSAGNNNINDDGSPGNEDDDEDKPVEGVDELQSPSPTSILNNSRENEEDENDSIRSSADHTRGPGGGGSQEEIEGTNSAITQDLSTSGVSTSNSTTTRIPHFPPAYRPASVRSLPRQVGSSSSSSGPSQDNITSTSSDDPPVLSGTEKTQAPGYYPAPATEDGEIALAVVSRSEGKSRLIEPPSTTSEDEEEQREEERIRHIATDDKRVLERLRLGASAPPVTRSEQPQPGERDSDIGEGPSAPTVQVDHEGFEQLDVSHLHVPSTPGLQHTISSSAIQEGILPAPPKLNARLSSRLNTVPSSLTDTSHLLPSAPPSNSTAEITQDLPSAPPMLGDGDDNEVEISAPPAPSAPLFDSYDEEHEPNESHHSSGPSATSSSTEEDQQDQTTNDNVTEQVAEESRGEGAHGEGEDEGESAQHRDCESTFANAVPSTAGPGSAPVFLPRYEP
ncbi:uncharacterized protein L201_002558 [Kwoniella dendrophila CBS 6074]|uniref:Uncharacterized protein n=1 Tax=Kwoniella dendrophila CBS 6074 TaxID=1295534 RepID=A0AAX4JQG8_9TREE